MAAGERARQIHHFEQLSATMQRVAREVLAPYYETLIALDFPQPLAFEMVRDLQAQLVDPKHGQDDDDDD